MKLFDDVEIIEATHSGRPVQLTLLRGGQRIVLLDAGTPTILQEAVLPALRERRLGPGDLDLVLITHADVDHFGGAAALRAGGAKMVACGEADRPLIEDPDVMIARRSNRFGEYGVHMSDAAKDRVRGMTGGGVAVDLSLVGGEAIRLAEDWVVHVLATPGHTDGHIGVHDPKHRAFYGADAIHGAVYLGRDGTAKLPPTYERIEAYLGTIDRIASLDLDVYVGCHWPVMRGDQIAAFCAESRGFVERTERCVLEAIRKGEARTLRDLLGLLGPQLGDWPRERDGALVPALAGHLDRLTATGRLKVESADGVNHYHAALQTGDERDSC